MKFGEQRCEWQLLSTTTVVVMLESQRKLRINYVLNSFAVAFKI